MATNRRLATVGAFVLGFALFAVARTDEQVDEVERHLSKLRPKLEDRSLSAAERAVLALEMASTLDRAAQGETKPVRQRACWLEAAELLERFNFDNPNHPKSRSFSLQAAVYRWARAKTRLVRLEVEPTDEPAREAAIKELDAVLRTFNRLLEERADAQDEVSQNVRFRLAQALADRAWLDDDSSLEKRRSEERAVQLLEHPPIRLDSLLGHAHWLRADLLTRLERFADALPAIEAAERARHLPNVSSVVALKVRILTGLNRFDEALQTIEKAKIARTEKSWLALRVALARRSGMSAKDPGRLVAEAEAIERLNTLKKLNSPEARPALLDLARAIGEPAPGSKPEVFETLAEGRFLLGDSEQATRLLLEGADRAETLKDPTAAGRLRYRAAAFLYQNGEDARCDRVLSKILDEPRYGSIRSRASLLRILARQRTAEGGNEVDIRSYVDSLTRHLKDFADDPLSGEARWRLGKVRLGSGDRREAFALWSAIGRDSSRWLESRLAILEALREEIASRRKLGDQTEAERLRREAETVIVESRKHARDAAERFAFQLESIRLDLLPGIGNARAALESCDRLREEPGRLSQREAAERLRIVALALNDRFLEADRAAGPIKGRLHSAEALDMARLLDVAAELSESDGNRRRMGRIMADLLAPFEISGRDPAEANLRDEFFLRRARGLAFAGSTDAAWKTVLAWNPETNRLDEARLDALADLEIRLRAFDRAVSTYRLLLKRRPSGSLAWLDARYGLALALERSGRSPDALRLIRATELLHPELGAPGIKAKFERLKREIDRR